jgi:hypothetical protein
MRVLCFDSNAKTEDIMTRRASKDGRNWYVQSLSDHDTHRGHLRQGHVQAVCGIEFTPVQAGRRSLALAGKPPDPEQICQKCRSTEHEPR